jgi:hypothetical protein
MGTAVIPGRDTSPVLQPAECIFNKMSLLIQRFIKGKCSISGSSGWYIDCHLLDFQEPADEQEQPVAMIPLADGSEFPVPASLAVIGMTLLTGCLWFVREELAALMTNDPAVRAEAVRYLVFNFLSAPLMVANLVLIGVFIGAGATQYSLWSYLISVWGVRLPLSWWLGHVVTASSSGVYWAMVVSQLVQLGMLLRVLFRTDWKRFALMSPDKRA